MRKAGRGYLGEGLHSIPGALIMALSTEDLLTQGEFWAMVLVLAVALLNWPFLQMASGGLSIGGFPFILVYLVAVWVMIIIVLFMFDRSTGE
jgi:hypothetical protein